MSSSVFEAMRESYALTRELGLPNMKSQYWSDLLGSGRQDYGGKGDFIERDELWTSFRSNVITKGLDNANVPDDALDRVHAKWRRIYRELSTVVPERFRAFFEETPVGRPRSVEIDGRRMTQSSLEYTFMLSHLEPYLADAGVIVDIGGGYGGLARLLRLNDPRLRIVLLDLPEVNAIQTYFLSTCFPEAKVRTLRDVTGFASLDLAELDFDFLVLPGPFIERLTKSSFDFVINTRSMMEMDLPTVSFYLGHIQDKLRVGGTFYCVNRYQKKTRLKDYPFDEKWYVSYSSPWPSFIDENPHHELIAVRAPYPVIGGLREQVAEFPPREGGMQRIRQRVRNWGRDRDVSVPGH
jgi:putative sugar O-methyltransferase